jgi:hypothetical protein
MEVHKNKINMKKITELFFKIFFSERFDEIFDLSFSIEKKQIFVSLISKKQIDFELWFYFVDQNIVTKVILVEENKEFIFKSIFDALNFCKKEDTNFFNDIDFAQDFINMEISKLKKY